MDLSWEKTWRTFYPETLGNLISFRASAAALDGTRICLTLYTSAGDASGRAGMTQDMTPEQMRACAGAMLSAADYAEALTERLHAARAKEAAPC